MPFIIVYELRRPAMQEMWEAQLENLDEKMKVEDWSVVLFGRVIREAILDYAFYHQKMRLSNWSKIPKTKRDNWRGLADKAEFYIFGAGELEVELSEHYLEVSTGFIRVAAKVLAGYKVGTMRMQKYLYSLVALNKRNKLFRDVFKAYREKLNNQSRKVVYDEAGELLNNVESE